MREINDKKVVLITGSSRGIGRALAIGYAKNGYKVVVNYHNSEKEAQEVISEIKKFNGIAIACKADVSERKDVIKLKEIILKEFGRLDILINNAGINKQKTFWEIDDEEWDYLMKVNLKSVFICSQEFMPLMIENKWGRIINMSSVSGEYGGPKTLHYASSKGAIISLTKGLARYGAPNVLVNAVSPGIIKTEMTEKELEGKAGEEYLEKVLLKKAGSMDDILETCLYLSSDKQNYTTGHTLRVNGGLYI
ncbi:MAG: 3-oxoacyl-ACP reductase family protein [Aliarcobacter sp.]|jgi:3-oxoacyl-[acyl-carrier protein] reductase|nr:3-oxoacyl-ACP reductase family protein [Aliarcobacter sp.]